MTRLLRSYGRRTEWHDCWGRDLLRRMHARELREERDRVRMRAFLTRAFAEA